VVSSSQQHFKTEYIRTNKSTLSQQEVPYYYRKLTLVFIKLSVFEKTRLTLTLMEVENSLEQRKLTKQGK